MNADLSRLRSLIGASARLWAGDDGVVLEDRGWTALSGARAVPFNVVLCHGASAGADLETGVERIIEAGMPGVMMVAGRALGEVQTLVALGWACVGSVPLMMMDLDLFDTRRARQPAVGRLGADQLDAVRAIVGAGFGIDPEAAQVAIPVGATQRTGQSVWGAFDADGQLASCLAAVQASEVVVIWSMATTPEARGRGYGASVLRAALAAHSELGTRAALLYSTPAGEFFYQHFGFRILERWQLWSRPRWALGRA